MRPKAILQKTQCTNRRIQMMQYRINCIRERAKVDNVKKGDAEKEAALLEGLERLYTDKLRTLCQEELAVIKAIQAIEDTELQEILELYYLDGRTRQEVCDITHHTLRTFARRLNAAIEAFDIKYGEVLCNV